MREIKFRAWHIKDGFMTNKFERWNISVLNNKEYNVMQYIGLKDKNGKEIYEGDIIKYGIHLPSVVRFERLQWFPLSIYSELSKVEIIGNIYENPELIK